MTDDERDAILAPLASFCEEYGYRWRWKVEAGERWKGTVQILDPNHEARRDKVRAWYSAITHDEPSALRQAVSYAVEGAQKRIDDEAIFQPGYPKPKAP